MNDGLISEKQAHALLKLAKKGLSKGGSTGGASIIDLHSGALSKGEHFINVYKSFPDLFQPEDFTIYSEVKETIKNYIAEHFDVEPNTLYLSHPTFFSRLDDKPAKTPHDEYWHVHIGKYLVLHIFNNIYV